MDVDDLRRALQGHSAVIAGLGDDVDIGDVVIGPPATAAEVTAVERELGLELPESFRSTLMTVARSIEWRWWTSGGFDAPFDEIFSGELSWSLDRLVEERKDWQGWIDGCFPDPDDPYDAVWHDKLVFHSVANGDRLAVDLDPRRSGEVVYLSHDDGEGHGVTMASSLGDLVDRWVPLACPGSEDWQWLPFVPEGNGPIDPACPNGSAWIELVGLSPRPPARP